MSRKTKRKPPSANKATRASRFKWCYDYIQFFLFNVNGFKPMAFTIFFIEILLNLYIIKHVKYTEIDWKAYMQEVEGVFNGTLDYKELKGDTGPLVYPAGFVYVYGILYSITSQGKDIKTAQHLFMIFYLIMLYLLYRIYSKCRKVPPYVFLITVCISYRVHSIFVLRLFNDCIAVLFLYLSVFLFLSQRWSLGSVVYSFAVSIKMNILLYSPALLLIYIVNLGVYATITQLSICALVQLILGLPFLISNPYSYISQSFNLGRVFLHQWTVNWRFLPEDVFVNSYFHMGLLFVHALLLIYFSFFWIKCIKSFATLQNTKESLNLGLKLQNRRINLQCVSQLLLTPLFTANFIGILCSRSLHYQFYVWYYHTLPYLLWSTPFNNKVRLSIIGIIELCWNTYPSTVVSSLGLHLCHFAILYGLYKNSHIQMITTDKSDGLVKTE